MKRVERALASAHAAQGVYDLMKKLGAPLGLKEIGMPASELDRAADSCDAGAIFQRRESLIAPVSAICWMRHSMAGARNDVVLN